MKYENYFKEILESFPDNRKTVLLTILIKIDNHLFTECGFLKDDINNLRKEYKNILMEQNEENLAYKKDQEKSITGKFLNK